MSEEIKYYYIQLSPELKHLELYILSDVHYGNPFCDTERFIHQLAYIKNTSNAYVMFNGDLCESSLRTSKGDIFKQVGSPQDQRDWMIDQLLPIEDKVLMMTTGNHEGRVYQETGMDLSKDIAKALNCPYDPDGMLLKLAFGNRCRGTEDQPWVYRIDTTHGYGGARTKSAKAVKVERQGYMIAADIHAMSHDHVVNVAPDVSLEMHNRITTEADWAGNPEGFKSGKVTARRKMLIKTNAYLRWGGYSRRGGFPPTDMVTPTIWLAGEEIPWPGGMQRWKPQVRVIV